MKRSLSFFVVFLFTCNLHSYEAAENGATHLLATAEPVNLDSSSDEDPPLPPTPTVMNKPFISFKCVASLKALKIVKDKNSKITYFENKGLKMKKDLGRLQPNEQWFKNANNGSIDFEFKIRGKTLKFDLNLQGPELTENSETNTLLYISLGYHKDLKKTGKDRTVASKEINAIDLDADKTLPGGFSLEVSAGEKVVEGHLVSLKVHCTEPKKEIRQVEVFIF